MSGPDLLALPGLPKDAEGPVFAEPWQAQAFALAVRLHAEGAFTWTEWAAALSQALAGDPRRRRRALLSSLGRGAGGVGGGPVAGDLSGADRPQACVGASLPSHAARVTRRARRAAAETDWSVGRRGSIMRRANADRRTPRCPPTAALLLRDAGAVRRRRVVRRPQRHERAGETAEHPDPRRHRLHRAAPGGLCPVAGAQGHGVQPWPSGQSLARQGRGADRRPQHRRPEGAGGPRMGRLHRQPHHPAVLGPRRRQDSVGPRGPVHLHLHHLGRRLRRGRRGKG